MQLQGSKLPNLTLLAILMMLATDTYGNWRVMHYASANSPHVVINAGRSDGLDSGMLLKAYRPQDATSQEVTVETGMLKIEQVDENSSVAKVVTDSHSLANSVLGDYSMIMAGDDVRRVHYVISPNKAITPTLSIGYYEIFSDPKAIPKTFELTSSGMKILEEQAKVFADTRFSMLMIKGYTDHNGPADANQVESLQRALTVRQYLIDEMGYDPNRVVAIGMGEQEPADKSLVSGYRRNNRRIVIKVVPSAQL